MAPIRTSYHTINGQIRGETSSATYPNAIYLRDALGNVTETVTATSASTPLVRQRFRAYGQRAYQATGVTGPKFNYVGAQGCRSTGRQYANTQMRNRHYDVSQSRFTSQTLAINYLMGEIAYGYAKGNPAKYLDPSGLQEEIPGVGQGISYGASIASAEFNCAKTIENNWSKDRSRPNGLSWFHDCNHLFVHCMACCVLAKNYSASDANLFQDIDNRLSRGARPYPLAPGNAAACRKVGCDSGIKFSTLRSSCFAACTGKFSFGSGPNCSSKTGPKIDCHGRLLRAMPPLPGCKSFVISSGWWGQCLEETPFKM